MKVLICGAAPRKKTGALGWEDPWPILRELRKLPRTATIIHGAAPGADHLGGVMAEGLSFHEVIAVPAHWRHKDCEPNCQEVVGRAAGPIRNRKMLDMKPDLVLAFHDDLKNSAGTRNMVEIARKAGIEVQVITHKLEKKS